jgi:NAD(P)-dependent dehydrogenase (short-subunit alcohol dehydrogenase family)
MVESALLRGETVRLVYGTEGAQLPAPSTTAGRVWFITGASRGLGRAFSEAALDAGDRVAGAARTIAGLDELAAQHDGRLLPLSVDVTDRPRCSPPSPTRSSASAGSTSW